MTEGMRQGIDTAVGLMFTDGTVREHQLVCFYFLKGVGNAEPAKPAGRQVYRTKCGCLAGCGGEMEQIKEEGM